MLQVRLTRIKEYSVEQEIIQHNDIPVMLGHVSGFPFRGYQLGSDAVEDKGESHVDNPDSTDFCLNAAFGL